MESSDFYLIVIPLSCVIVTLITLVYYYAHREEISKRKSAKLIQGFLEKRVKQQQEIRTELGNLDQLFNDGSITEGTHQRLQNVLLMTQERQRFEAIIALGEKNKIFKKEPAFPLKALETEDNKELPAAQKPDVNQELAEAKAKKKTRAKTKLPKRKQSRKAQTGKPRQNRTKKELTMGVMASDNNPENALKENLSVDPS
jgi:hypothetical protein